MTSPVALPVDPAEGFPQAFLLAFGSEVYGFTWYVNIAEAALPPLGQADPTMPIDLLGETAGGAADLVPRGILVLVVDRRDPDGVTPLLRRRIIPGQTYLAGQLRLAVNQAVVAVGNLNGVGSFGSVLDVQVSAA
jgi:hypothetical protein